MEKKEVKKTFDNFVKDIKVTNELKVKTLNKIYCKNNVYHFPYWIKNCAAIFVVTCLCLSIYLINNKPLFNSRKATEDITFSTLEKASEPINLYNNSKKIQSTPIENYGTVYDNFSIEQSRTEAIQEKSSNAIMQDINSDFSQKYIGLTENEFLIKNPNAKKTEDGYIIIENGRNTLYKIKDGIISERLIK